MSSCCTVARETCTPLPRMLISRSSSVIVFVGYDTLMVSPPVKNGFTRWRSGDIICIRQMSDASGGTVTRSCRLQEGLRFEREVADHRRLAAGRHVLVLHRLERLHPVVAEPQLARRLLHLGFAPRVLAVADFDQLLRRVRDHLARKVLQESFAPDRISHDLVVGRRGLRGLAPSPAPRPPPMPGPAAAAGAAPASPPIFWRTSVE